MRIFYYLFSSNKEIYKRLAEEYDVKPIDVYDLAHGKRAISLKDYSILDELAKLGLISGWMYR
ncbi:hypothetical protein D0T57_05925 [Dysgonomonas sp. 511]|nr:hypothetical protein [Dysgonomonas sp. 511]